MVIANYMWQRDRNRKKEEHERRMERFDRLMELLKKPNSDKEAQVGDTTEDEESS
jgi:hypothetical protein